MDAGRWRGSWGSRAGRAVLVGIALALGACGGGGGREGDAGANFETERESAADTGPASSAPPITLGGPPSDTTLVLNEAGQLLLDEAVVEVEAEDDRSVTIVAELPTGNTSTTTYTVDPDVDLPSADASLPGSPVHGLEVTGEVTDEGLEWSYRYTVPLAVFPPDALASSAAPAEGGLATRLLRALLRPERAWAQEGPGVEVAAQGVIKEFGKEGLARLEESLGEDVSGGMLTELTDALLNVFEAVTNSIEFQETMRRIDELRACAMNPTNPLTQRLYEEDPAARQHVLNEIARVEAELRTDMAVRFIGALNSQATGLASAKWLGFIIGPLTSWVDAGIEALGKEAIAEVERLVEDCDAFVWTGTITRTMTNDWEDERTTERPCGGGDFTCTSTDATSETERVEESWELTGEQVSPDAPLAAVYSLEASYVQEESTYQTARASCPGDEQGGLHETSSSGIYSSSATVSEAGEGEVTISIDTEGFFSISAAASLDQDPEASGTWSQVDENTAACGASGERERESGSFSYQPGEWGMFFIEGTINPSNPFVLSGSETETESGENWTITRTYTWDLEQRPAGASPLGE